jgi:hypothetical protein
VIKWWNARKMRDIARLKEKQSTYNIFVGTPEKKTVEDLDFGGINILR